MPLVVPWETILIGFIVALPFLVIKRYLVRVLLCAFAPAIIVDLTMCVLWAVAYGDWRGACSLPARGLASQRFVVLTLGYAVGGLCAAHMRLLWPSTRKKSS